MAIYSPPSDCLYSNIPGYYAIVQYIDQKNATLMNVTLIVDNASHWVYSRKEKKQSKELTNASTVP
ncbi:MAG TPA: hypothetical protein VIP56_11955 [Nitrososphaeraceae archaeon]